MIQAIEALLPRETSIPDEALAECDMTVVFLLLAEGIPGLIQSLNMG